MVAVFWYILFMFSICNVHCCDWVCIDKNKMSSKNAHQDVQLMYSNMLISVPTALGEESAIKTKNKPKIKKHGLNPFFAVSLREPQIINVPEFGVKPREPTYNVDPIQTECKSQEFGKNVSAVRRKTNCTPREVLVDVISKEGKVIPSKVVTKICGGFCSGARKCVATKSTNVTLAVRVNTAKGVKCSTIVVPEDKKCGCRCQTKPDSCNSEQRYNKRTCSCDCINDKERFECREEAFINKLRRWDSNTCSCVCIQQPLCTTGTTWDKNICRCLKTKH